MMKLLFVAMMALGLGMGVASAATTSDHSNWPTVVRNGPPAATSSY